jgi:hypothetical protein
MQIWHAAINDVTRSLEITGLIEIRRRIVALQLTLGTGRYLLHATFSLDLQFYTKDRRDIFLGNVDFQCTTRRYASI